MSLQLAHRWDFDAEDCAACVAFDPRGQAVAVALASGPVLVLDAATGQVRCRLAGHPPGTNALCWSADGTVLATGGQDGAALAWNVGSGKSTTLVSASKTWVEKVACDPSSDWIAIAAGKRVTFAQAASGVAGAGIELESTVTGLVWVGKRVLASCYGGVRALEPGKLEVAKKYNWKGSVLGVFPSPDGRFIVCPTQESAVHIWKLKGGEDFEMTGFPAKVRNVAFAPNSNAMANDGGKHITVWDFRGRGPAGREPLVCEGHKQQVTFVGFSRAGDTAWVVSASRDGTVRAWGEKPRTLPVGDRRPLEVGALSPDERQLVVADDKGRLTAIEL